MLNKPPSPLPTPHTGMVKRVANAKIACLDFSLQKTKMKMGVQVVISDPEKLDQIRQRLWDLCPLFVRRVCVSTQPVGCLMNRALCFQGI